MTGYPAPCGMILGEQRQHSLAILRRSERARELPGESLGHHRIGLDRLGDQLCEHVRDGSVAGPCLGPVEVERVDVEGGLGLHDKGSKQALGSVHCQGVRLASGPCCIGQSRSSDRHSRAVSTGAWIGDELRSEPHLSPSVKLGSLVFMSEFAEITSEIERHRKAREARYQEIEPKALAYVAKYPEDEPAVKGIVAALVSGIGLGDARSVAEAMMGRALSDAEWRQYGSRWERAWAALV